MLNRAHLYPPNPDATCTQGANWMQSIGHSQDMQIHQGMLYRVEDVQRVFSRREHGDEHALARLLWGRVLEQFRDDVWVDATDGLGDQRIYRERIASL